MNISASEVEYYYSSDKANNTISETGLNTQALYDCSFQMGRLFLNNNALVNAFGISSSGGIVFFQGKDGDQPGLFFVREGEVEFLPYGKANEGQIRVFSKKDPVIIGIKKKSNGSFTVGTEPSFNFGGLRFPRNSYDTIPKAFSQGDDFSRAFGSGIDRCFDNFCTMLESKKKAYEDKTFKSGKGKRYPAIEEYGALQTCRFVLKDMGQLALASKAESLIRNCLKLETDPRKEIKDDKKKSGTPDNSDSVR
ncbi:MAG: hypothetical protein Fur0010_26870 [Bdellovibrio sp.]